MTQVLIYALFDPRSPSEIRYVGKTISPLLKRLTGHKSQALSGHRGKRSIWIRSLIADGVIPEIKLLLVSNAEDWQSHEKCQISLHTDQGHRLTNATIGGDGVHDPTGEVRRKISASKKGHVVSPETKAKIKAARSKQVYTDETRRKMSLAGLGRKHSEASIAKMKMAQAGRTVSAEGRKNISLSKLGHTQSDETRLKRSLALKGRVFSPETKEKLRLAALRRYEKLV